jgi:formiminotetrahydrofolate cyclodeaminase
MKLTEMSIGAFLEAVRSPAPVPGGGSAAALAGATGASLLTMVAAMPKHRAGSEAETAALRTAGEECASIDAELTRLINEDSDAYGGVMAAYRLPKTSEGEKDERNAAIQAALKSATEVPLAVMRRAVQALTAAAAVGRLGNPNASSDVGVAVELLAAACRGAALNVGINLEQIKDTAYAGRVREDAGGLSARCDEAAAAAHRALGP